MVLRRLSGRTENTSPVLTLVTQFGGGKTHTLTSLYHLANAGSEASRLPGVVALLTEAGMATVPACRVGVFAGNAWDPAEGRETPWVDIARQLAGERGVAALGAAARTAPPGTEALGRVFAAAEAPVLLLFDEVLNFVNRHRRMAESFHAFIQNLTVVATGATRVAAVISLPRSQVEMTDWDRQWQDRITKVVRRVARDLIANDEAEIGEVVRRRLFEDLGDERIRRRLAKPTRTGASSEPPAFPRMDGRGQRDHRSQGAGVSERAVRGLLPLPPFDALRLPPEMEHTRSVPTDPRCAGDAGAVDFLGGARAFRAGANGTADHPRLGPAGCARVPRRRPRPVGRAAP